MKEERNDAFILYYVYIYKNVVSLFANARKRERGGGDIDMVVVDGVVVFTTHTLTRRARRHSKTLALHAC
jgi:hypothetical protein